MSKDLYCTVESERCGQFHQGNVITQSFGSVSRVVYDLLHGDKLGPVAWLLCQSH